MYKGKTNKIQFCRQPCKSSVTDPEGPCALMPKGRVLGAHWTLLCTQPACRTGTASRKKQGAPAQSGVGGWSWAGSRETVRVTEGAWLGAWLARGLSQNNDSTLLCPRISAGLGKSPGLSAFREQLHPSLGVGLRHQYSVRAPWATPRCSHV